MTEFSTVLSTAIPKCNARGMTYEISRVSGSTVTPTGLNAVDIRNGTHSNITPTDATSTGYQMHKFYIRAGFTTG